MASEDKDIEAFLDSEDDEISAFLDDDSPLGAVRPDSLLSRRGLVSPTSTSDLDRELEYGANRPKVAPFDAGALGRGIESMAGLGLIPRAAAAVGAALDPDATYSELLDYENRKISEAHQRNPRDFALGGAVGTIADPANFIGGAPVKGGGILANAGKQALVGTARGGVRGYAGAAPGQELKGAIGGAVIEGGLGAVAGAATGAASKFGNRAPEFEAIANKAKEGEQYAKELDALPAKRAFRNAEVEKRKRAFEEARDAYRKARNEHKARIYEATDAHAAEVERVRLVNEAARARHAQEVQAARESNALAKSQHAEEVSRLRDQAIADALEESRRPTADKAARIFGLEAKQSKLGGPEAVDRIAERLFGRKTPEGASYLENALNADPKAGMQWLRDQQKRVGSVLGEIRDQIGNSGVGRPVAALKEEFRSQFETLPPEARAAAIEHVNELLRDASRGGVIDAKGLRKLIEDVGRPGYQVGSLETSLGDRAKDVYRKAYKVLTNEEKGFVEHLLPDQYQRYLDNLEEARDLFDAVAGQTEKMRRGLAGTSPIKWPTPGKPNFDAPPTPAEIIPPDAPEVLRPPASPVPLLQREAPVAPTAPRMPAPVPTPAKPGGLAKVEDYVDTTFEQRLPTIAGGVGAILGGRTVGGLSGVVLGRGLGRLAGTTLKNSLGGGKFHHAAEGYAMAQERALMSMRIAEKWAKAGDRMARWAPFLSSAIDGGLNPALVAHQALLNEDPEYANLMAELENED